jgi:hypothetical protein
MMALDRAVKRSISRGDCGVCSAWMVILRAAAWLRCRR